MRRALLFALAGVLATHCPGQQSVTPTAVPAAAVTTQTSTPATPAAPPKSYLRDEAEVFSSAQRARLDQRVRRLFGASGCEIHVCTKIVGNFDGFEAVCDTLFRDVVKEAGHYKLVLIVLGYEGTAKPGTGRGKVYTALAAGLMHVLSKQKLESLLSRGGQKVTNDTVVTGIEDLAASLETYFKRTISMAATLPQTLIAETADPRLRMDLLAGIGGVLLLVLLARRMTRCPQCGARLRKQVKILPAGAEGGSHAVRRTAKCFTCGYVRKGSFF